MKPRLFMSCLLAALIFGAPNTAHLNNVEELSSTAEMQLTQNNIAQPAPIYNLRLYAIKCSNSDGTQETPITKSDVKEWVDKANKVFYISSAGIQIQFDSGPNSPDWSTVKNSTLNHLSAGDPSSWSEANKVAAAHPGKMVVFFRWAAGSGPDANKGNGFSYPPQTGSVVNFIALPGFNNTYVNTGSASVQNIWQLSHDTGHFLGLPHTFPDTSDAVTDTPAKAAEYIKTHGGTASALDGDGIADTPPEAGTSFYKTNGWNFCTGHDSYTISGTKLDGKPFSYTFTPDRHNIMSYFACETMKFTKGQVARMRQTLLLPSRKLLIAPIVEANNPEIKKKMPSVEVPNRKPPGR